MKLIYFFCGCPVENVFRHPHFRKQEYYFFWPNERIIDDLTRPVFAPKRLNTEISKHYIVFFKKLKIRFQLKCTSSPYFATSPHRTPKNVFNHCVYHRTANL